MHRFATRLIGVLACLALAAPAAAVDAPQASPGELRTVAGGGYTDGRPAREVPLNWVTDVALAPDGSVYLAVQNDHRVRRIGVDGVITTIAGNGEAAFAGDGGPATAASLLRPSNLAFDAAGNVYIADEGNHRVRKVDSNGIITTVAGNGTQGGAGDGGPATQAQLQSPGGLAFGPDGSLYIAEGAAHRVRRVDPAGTISTFAGTGVRGGAGDGGPAAAAQLNFPYDVAVDGAGRVFITDGGNWRLRVVNPAGTIEAFAGTGQFGDSGDGGPALLATMGVPRTITAAADGTVLFTDQSKNRIRAVRPDGTIVAFAGTGARGLATEGAPAAESALDSPHSVIVAPDGTVLFAELGSLRLRSVGADGLLRTVAGTGDCCHLGDGELATDAALYAAQAAAFLPDGTMLIADTGNHRIRAVDPVTRRIRTWAGTGEFGDTGDGGPANQAKLWWPNDVEVDASGNVYIADSGNHIVRKVTPDGIIRTFAGTGVQSFAGDGGPAVAAAMNTPTGLGVGPDGAVYIADAGNDRIRRVGGDGVIRTVVGNGTLRTLTQDGLPAALAGVYLPWDVAVGEDGTIYYSDLMHQLVREVRPASGPLGPTVHTIAGTGTEGYSGDGGPGTSAMLAWPTGVDIDAAGNVYIADLRNHRVRMVDASGAIRTVVGDGTPRFAGDFGPAHLASLRAPVSVEALANGELYIADQNNHRIRRRAPGPLPAPVSAPRAVPTTAVPTVAAEMGLLPVRR